MNDGNGADSRKTSQQIAADKEHERVSLLEMINSDRVLGGAAGPPPLRSLTEGGRDGWEIKHLMMGNQDIATVVMNVIVEYGDKFQKKLRTLLLDAHRAGAEHGPSSILVYASHPITGELYLATSRQNRVAFYFDQKELDDAHAWVSEIVRGFSNPRIEAEGFEAAAEAAERLEVLGLEPWMPKYLKSDVRRLFARELGDLLFCPEIELGPLQWYGRYNENSGRSTVFVNAFAIEAKIQDPAVFERHFGPRRARITFHPYSEICEESRRARAAFGFGKEALSLAALWLFEKSDRYKHLFQK